MGFTVQVSDCPSHDSTRQTLRTAWGCRQPATLTAQTSEQNATASARPLWRGPMASRDCWTGGHKADTKGAPGRSWRQCPRLAIEVLLCLSAMSCSVRTPDAASGSTPAPESRPATASGSTPAPESKPATAGGHAAGQSSAASGGNSDPGSNGVPGAPINRGDGGGAVGAPIKIPSAVTDEGKPLGQMQALIERSIRDQCGGGTLCVNVRVERLESGSHTTCEFVRTEPAQGTNVGRGTTVVIVSGIEPCSPLLSSQPSTSTSPAGQLSQRPSSGSQPPPSAH
jgi:hypothetical protein